MYNQPDQQAPCYGSGMKGTSSKAGPANTDKPSGIVEQACGLVSDAMQQVITARVDLSRVGDRLLGIRPECDTNEQCGNLVPDGRGLELLNYLNALYREIAALRAEITRLDAL
jgi:hypothetical protein